MQDCIRLPEMIEELVTESLALVGIRDKAGDIDQVHGYKPVSVNTMTAFKVKAMAWAFRSHVRDAEVGVNSRERIIGNFGICHSCCLEKGRFSTVWFACESKSDHGWFLKPDSVFYYRRTRAMDAWDKFPFS
jgi:hypothetical protein